MDVAIIGAGLSGLACAFQLEKMGVRPVIFEKNLKVGDYHPTAEAMLDILYRPIIDPYQHLSKEYGLFLKPHQTVQSLLISSSSHNTVIDGLQGFINLRGNIDSALEQQFLKIITSPITFESKFSYREILNEYDYVIVATGDIEYVSKIQPIKVGLTTSLRLANIVGEFRSDQPRIWLNHDIAPQGYAYMLPWNGTEATVAIGIPNQKGVDLENLFERYLENLDFPYQIKRIYDVQNYVIGQPEKNQVGNTLFIGNAGGFLKPFMGFGQFTSIISGLLAGKAIIENLDYNQVVREYRKDYRRSLAMRRMFGSLTQQQYNHIVQGLKNPITQKAYLNKHVNIVKWVGGLLATGHKN